MEFYRQGKVKYTSMVILVLSWFVVKASNMMQVQKTLPYIKNAQKQANGRFLRSSTSFVEDLSF